MAVGEPVHSGTGGGPRQWAMWEMTQLEVGGQCVTWTRSVMGTTSVVLASAITVASRLLVGVHMLDDDHKGYSMGCKTHSEDRNKRSSLRHDTILAAIFLIDWPKVVRTRPKLVRLANRGVVTCIVVPLQELCTHDSQTATKEVCEN